MDYFIPDIYQKSIYTINYEKLKDTGIKCILIDLDNTLVPVQVKEPTKKVIELVDHLKDLGFKVIIISNNNKKRLTPFKELLEVDCSCNSLKPLKIKYKKILKEYKFNESEVACIGDQLVTDVFGGNRMGFRTIFVNSISKKDLFSSKFNRFIERIILNKLKKKGLFEIGKYYE
ncbi:MAG: YqeG family HAD IIIA-type phosphatase [Bacilli bacterium]|nr:YqeG family HAD IIIA-type phosphatase [Bacilli bacterium]